MRVAVIEDTANHQQHQEVLHAFAKGCGGDITNSGNTKGYDCAVIFGSYKKEKGRSAQKGKGKVIESGIPYVQLETQLIGRPIDTALHTEFRVESMGSFGMMPIGVLNTYTLTDPKRFLNVTVTIPSYYGRQTAITFYFVCKRWVMPVCVVQIFSLGLSTQ